MKTTVKQLKVKDVLIGSGFKKTSPEATIASVFSQLRSSHDAVFVFKEKKFLGLINLYYSFLKKRPPALAKIAKYLYRPPRLSLETTIAEAARLMVESRVYHLPVFKDSDDFLGIVSARRILKWLTQQAVINLPVNELFVLKPPLFVSLKDGIGKVRNLMVERRTSRLLVTDRKGKVVGIVSSYDLRQPFTSPVETVHFLSRTPIKKEIADIPVENYFQRNLVSVSEKEPLKNIVELILKKGIGSVAVYNRSPLGLVTIRDVLKLVWQVYGGKKGTVLDIAADKLTPEERQAILDRVKQSISRQPFLLQKVADVRLVFSWLAKRGVRQPLIKIRALITTEKNQTLHVKARGRKVFSVVNQLVARIKRRLRRQ